MRKQHVQVSELFKVNGMHAFTKGWNMRAVWVFIATSIPTILIAVLQIDFCRFLSPFSWFIGAGLAFACHYLVSKNDPYVINAVKQAMAVDLDADRDAIAR